MKSKRALLPMSGIVSGIALGLLSAGALWGQGSSGSAAANASGTAPAVQVVRLPAGALEPVLVESGSRVDLVYLSGEASHADLRYLRFSAAGTPDWSRALAVGAPGTVQGVGQVRGARLTLAGPAARRSVVVVWSGSAQATPRGPHQQPPLLVARLAPGAKAFSAPLPLIHDAWDADGDAIAGNAAGDVEVFWHAPALVRGNETHREVWMARSRDGGRSFAREVPVAGGTPAIESAPAGQKPVRGVCGCCGMAALANGRRWFALYRATDTLGQRDMVLLFSPNGGRFRGEDVSAFAVSYCVMSTPALVPAPEGVLAAWERGGQVYWGVVDGKSGLLKGRPIAVGAEGTANENAAASASTAVAGAAASTPAGGVPAMDRRHPALAVNAQGQVLVAWTEGMGWGKGGEAAWQLFSPEGQPLGAQQHAAGVPASGLVAAYARPDGRFVVLY